MHAFEEMLSGHGGDRHKGGRMNHPGRILRWAEDSYLPAGGSKGFDAFVDLLAIIERRRQAVNFQIWICDENGLTPSFRVDIIMRLDMTVDWPPIRPILGVDGFALLYVPSLTRKPTLFQSMPISV